MRRGAALLALLATLWVVTGGTAWACGGLVAANGAVRLVRTSTLAAYSDGVEHYVTSFTFGSAQESFGSIVPLPDVPVTVERAGDWTLQRLAREVRPVDLTEAAADATAQASRAEVLLETQVDALDITILRGGGEEVADWAAGNGFALSDDAPAVLDFYAARSPIFMAARFDADRAAQDGFVGGDGIPIHLAIPTDDPWVPLRILALGKPAEEVVEADVYLLTEREPAVLHGDGVRTEVSRPAGAALLDDLRSDANSAWVPDEAWLSYLRVEAPAAELDFDLAIDVSAARAPSAVDAGLTLSPHGDVGTTWAGLLVGAIAIVAVALTVGLAARPRFG